jgi:hypothetical protein
MSRKAKTVSEVAGELVPLLVSLQALRSSLPENPFFDKERAKQASKNRWVFRAKIKAIQKIHRLLKAEAKAGRLALQYLVSSAPAWRDPLRFNSALRKLASAMIRDSRTPPNTSEWLIVPDYQPFQLARPKAKGKVKPSEVIFLDPQEAKKSMPSAPAGVSADSSPFAPGGPEYSPLSDTETHWAAARDAIAKASDDKRRFEANDLSAVSEAFCTELNRLLWLEDGVIYRKGILDGPHRKQCDAPYGQWIARADSDRKLIWQRLKSCGAILLLNTKVTALIAAKVTSN